jgi:hypothetical protein
LFSKDLSHLDSHSNGEEIASSIIHGLPMLFKYWPALNPTVIP